MVDSNHSADALAVPAGRRSRSAWRCRGRVLAMAASVCVTAGCYRYAAVPVSGVEQGMAVRVRLSAIAVDRIRQNGTSSQARLTEGFTVKGRVAGLAADTMMVTVQTSIMDASGRPRTVDEQLSLLRSDVVNAELRRLDRKRTTWAVVALGAATAASVTVVLRRGGRSTGSTQPPVPGPEARLPLFRWQLP